jgi:hypothetical protein
MTSKVSEKIWSVCKSIYYRIVGLCKTLRLRDYGAYDFKDFEPQISPANYASKGDLTRLKRCKGYDMNECLKCAVENNQKEVVEYLLSEGKADNLDQCLALACTKNYYDVSELLVKGGAKFVFGLRASRSPNITRMLYRYEQGSEVIM